MTSNAGPNWIDTDRPRLRPVQITPAPGDGEGVSYVITDAQQLAPMALTVSPPVLFILALLDGCRSLSDLRNEFLQQVGEPLQPETLGRVLSHLQDAHLLHGDRFDQFYNGLVGDYARSPSRPLRNPEIYGDLDQLRAQFEAILSEHAVDPVPFTVTGLIAPHLDYPRGAPCYGRAYSLLRNRRPPDRVVILGTNHFGRSTGACATGKDFQTPLGTSRCDVAFLDALEIRCGSLRTFEMDHAREHSIELQVLWLQHLFGAETFRMVAVLCPDPSGPTGTAPRDGVGVDLGNFNRELGRLLLEDGQDTVLIAGADLSHVGTFFGEDRPLSDDFLKEVAAHDQELLDAVERRSPAEFRDTAARTGNPTNVCSIGCIYSLLEALQPTQARKLGYHQAVTWEVDNCVTCAAFAFGH